MCVVDIPRKIQCSKCGSQNIVKPVNNDRWIYKCLDCGHTKLNSPPVTIVSEKWVWVKEDPNKPVEF